MEQRVSLITLAVADVARSRAFYVGGLRWVPCFTGDDILMFQVGQAVVLSLWERDAFAQKVGEPADGRAPVTLAHNVPSGPAVEAVLREAEEAGARVWPARDREWGGYSGYFADPDGYRWEVAWNPPGGEADAPLTTGRPPDPAALQRAASPRGSRTSGPGRSGPGSGSC